MTNEQILKKAIEKAVKNGWTEGELTIFFMDKMGYSKELAYGVIFSHSFAKAFWGEEWVGMKTGRTFEQYWKEEKEFYTIELGMTKDEVEYDFDTSDRIQLAWCYHLQQIVLKEDKLKYLEKFL